MLKDALSDMRQFLATERELFKNDEKWFLFHLIFFFFLKIFKFSFLLFWSCRKTV